MLTCSDCSANIPEALRLEPCSACGSLRRTISVNPVETRAPIRDGIMIEKYVGGPGGKKKRFRLRAKSALPTFRKSDELPVRETQITDKERDIYQHTIVDEDGNVLHHETHRLSEHQGRGSAKFKKETNPE